MLISEVEVLRFDGLTEGATLTLESRRAKDLRTGVAMAGLVGRRIGIEPDACSSAIRRALTGVVYLDDATAILASARSVLDATGRARLLGNVAVIEQALYAATTTAAPGVTERAIAAAAHATVCEAVGRAVRFAGNMGSGPRSLDPNGRPGARRLKLGETFYLDLYPDLGLYSADLTRCFSLGAPSLDVRRVHCALEDALAAAVEAVRPGVTASAIDAAVRRVLAAHGLLAYFPHHSGHGLGLFLPEPPRLAPDDETPLVAGMALAIEPGVYLPGVGGLRLEVNVGVTGDGCEIFGHMPPELLVCH